MGVLRIAFLSSAVLELFSAMAVAVVAVYAEFSLLGYVRFGPSGNVTLAHRPVRADAGAGILPAAAPACRPLS